MLKKSRDKTAKRSSLESFVGNLIAAIAVVIVILICVTIFQNYHPMPGGGSDVIEMPSQSTESEQKSAPESTPEHSDSVQARVEEAEKKLKTAQNDNLALVEQVADLSRKLGLRRSGVSDPEAPIVTQVHEAPQILMGDSHESKDPTDRNTLLACYGQKGDEFVVKESPGGGYELWVERAGKPFQAIPGGITDPDGVVVPMDVYVLFDENNQIVGWMPTLAIYNAATSSKGSSQS